MKLHLEETGNKNGKTIIFIHACGVSSWMWYEQQRFFKDYHCILVDLPEHGLSINQKPFTINTAARSVAEIIKSHANNAKAYLIGHEMGGKVALEVLRNNESLVEKAVVSSVALRNGSEARMHEILPHKVIIWIFNLKFLALKFKSFQRFAAKEYGVRGEENVEKYLIEMKSYSSEQLVKLIHESFIVPFDIRGLESVQTPTLIMVGEKEIEHIKESAKDLSKVLPNSECVLVEEGTHAHPRTKCDIFNGAVSKWFEGTVVKKTNVSEITV